MLDLKELTIQDKSLFDAFLSAEDVQTSELTFTNLFIWQKYYGFRYCIIHNALVVIACGASEPFALFPIGLGQSKHPTLVIRELAEHFTGQGLTARIERADLRAVEYLDTLGVSYQAVRDEKNDDYVYLAQELITLRGRKYDGKRNHINRLLRQHTVEYMPLTDDDMSVADRVMDEWFSSQGELGAPEHQACQELTAHFHALGCSGALLLIDGVPAAVAFGEMLDRDTAVIHIEKAVYFVDGAYPAMNQSFVQHEWSHVTFINREQDLGLAGLKKAKQSWHPDRIVEKYKILLY